MSNKRKFIMPTPEEDAAITAAALSDPDNPPLSDEFFERAKPADEALPELLGKEKAEVLLKRRGRPAGSGSKEMISVRFDRDVIEAFRARGDGWQTRMNDALREWLKTHEPA